MDFAVLYQKLLLFPCTFDLNSTLHSEGGYVGAPIVVAAAAAVGVSLPLVFRRRRFRCCRRPLLPSLCYSVPPSLYPGGVGDAPLLCVDCVPGHREQQPLGIRIKKLIT